MEAADAAAAIVKANLPSTLDSGLLSCGVLGC